MSRRVLPVLALGALLFSTDAAAYRFLCNGMDAYGNVRNDQCSCSSQNAQRWPDGLIDWKIKRTGTNRVSSSAWMQEALRSLQGWNEVTCSDFLMRDLGDVSNPDFGTNEAQHTIWWISSASQYQQVVGGGVADTLGVTLSPYYIQGNCASRSTSDSDIVMNNAGGAEWTTDMGSCPGNCVDVASTLVHEVGHALGLGHPCTNNPQVGDSCPSGGTIMMAISGYREDIGQPLQDDINGLCALYPGTPGGLGSSCTSNGQCDSNLCITDGNVRYCSQACGTCPTGYSCECGQCRRALPQVGQPCTGSCAPGALCLGEQGSRQCYQECNPSGTNTCPSMQRCADIGQGVGVCVPEGTRQPGERCEAEDCASGASCYITELENDCSNDSQCVNGQVCGATNEGNKCIKAYCFQDCTTDQQCGSGNQCYELGQGANACIGARSENAACGNTDPFFLSTCAESLICVGGGTGGTCLRECTSNASACLTGQRCVTLSDNTTKVCVTEKFEGQTCDDAVCAMGLLCVQDTATNAHCFVDCSNSRPCPTGKFCNTYQPGTPNQISICELEQAANGASSSSGGSSGASGNTSSGGGSSSGGSSSGGVTSSGGTGGRAVGEACSVGAECQSGLCASTSNNARICVAACDPRLGHYDCPENAGCVANDEADLSRGGQCIPGDIGSGQNGDECSSGRDCEYGICSKSKCTVWCNDDGSCPSRLESQGYTCDQSEVTPGVCKPGTGGTGPGVGICACTSAPGEVPGLAFLTLALLGLFSVRSRRRP